VRFVSFAIYSERFALQRSTRGDSLKFSANHSGRLALQQSYCLGRFALQRTARGITISISLIWRATLGKSESFLWQSTDRLGRDNFAFKFRSYGPAQLPESLRLLRQFNCERLFQILATTESEPPQITTAELLQATQRQTLTADSSKNRPIGNRIAALFERLNSAIFARVHRHNACS